jgi:hypothetical protein
MTDHVAAGNNKIKRWPALKLRVTLIKAVIKATQRAKELAFS